MTTTDHSLMTTGQLAGLVLEHLAGHGLPEPASLHLNVLAFERQDIAVQLDSAGLAETARLLLTWAKTLATVALRAYRPPHGATVLLDARTTLTGRSGMASLSVYGGVTFDPTTFDGLEPGQSRPVSLGELTAWAGGNDAGVAA